MGLKPRLTLALARGFFAEELRLVTGGTSPAIERAFAAVPREAFLGPPPWRIGSPMSYRRFHRKRRARVVNPRELYHNVLVALDRNRNNGMPSLWYRLFEVVAPRAGERVVHVGAGTGYYTAVLAELVGRRGRVLGVEINRRLGAQARRNLAPWSHVTVRIADATRLEEPADVIVVSAGVAHPPRRWFQTKEPITIKPAPMKPPRRKRARSNAKETPPCPRRRSRLPLTSWGRSPPSGASRSSALGYIASSPRGTYASAIGPAG